MNPFKCRHCSRDAYWYFRDGGMLCPDHGALHATAQMKDMLERSRLDKSSCEPNVGVGNTKLMAGLPAMDARDVSAFGSQDSACASLEAPPGTSSAALSGSSGTPAQERPLTPFDDRKNATTFLVAASSAIHESSDIPQTHHQ